LYWRGDELSAGEQRRKGDHVSILWIILIVILVLALLGFFSRGRW
jgi:flagellar basal body-associated protein FliL